MKIKVKLQRVCATTAEGRAPFIEALQRVRKLALPAKTFYWLNKISQVVEKEFVDYEAARIQLVMRLAIAPGTEGTEGTEGTQGAAGTEGGCYRVPPEMLAEFQSQLATLDRDIELPLDEGVKLALPATGVAEDWFLLMTEMDIFEPPV